MFHRGLVMAFLVGTLASESALAALVLSFDSPTYTIGSVGQTTTVAVRVGQNPTGPQVGLGNALLTAAIRLDFTSAGIATPVAASAANWDNLSSSLTPNPAGFSVVSLLGISSLPVTLVTVTFQGLAPGTITLTAAQFDVVSPDFITEQGNVLDPSSAATAQLTVNAPVSAIPEPSSLHLGWIAACAAAWRLARFPTPRSGRF